MTSKIATSKIADLLIGLGISSPDSIKPFHDRVRDRADVPVSRCERSGVIFLDPPQGLEETDYARRDDLGYWAASTRREALKETFADDSRRARMIGPLIRNRRWLDVGTGVGGILDLCKDGPSAFAAVEPQGGPRDALRACGYEVHASIAEAPDCSFDLVTLFHVYEHIADPVAFLAEVARKVVPGGTVCIEVPHARDALLGLFGCAAFKDFTLWSEHLILHTRDSLSRFIAAAGLTDPLIQGVQRYPLANHLHWLAKGQPGGHAAWSQLLDDGVDGGYARLLSSLDATDSLVAWARKPPAA